MAGIYMNKFIFQNRKGLGPEDFRVQECRCHCRPSAEYVKPLQAAINEAIRSDEPINSLIKIYVEKIRANAEYCLNNKWSIADCLSGCHNQCYCPDASSHTHPHQARLAKIAKAELPAIIAEMEYDPEEITDFEKLYDWLKKAFDQFKSDGRLSEYKRSSYPSQMTIYDTALRMGYHNAAGMIMPERMVYLHRGALSGAKALKIYSGITKTNYLVTDNTLKDNCRIPVTSFSTELRSLGARDLEDFLCVFHNALKILADTTGNNPKPVPAIVPVNIC